MVRSHSPFGTCMLQLAAGGGHRGQSSGATMPCWVCAQAIEFHGWMRRRAASLPGATGPLARLGSIAPTRERPRAECDGTILRKEAVEIAQGRRRAVIGRVAGDPGFRPGQSRLLGLSTCPARACWRVYSILPRAPHDSPEDMFARGAYQDDGRATVVMAGGVLQP